MGKEVRKKERQIMAEQQTIVVGVFEGRVAVHRALKALRKAGFRDEQLSFAARTQEAVKEELEASSNALERGIVGGILGAADALLAPITGPSDASALLNTALPVAEDAIDRLPRRKTRPLALDASHSEQSAPPTVPVSRQEQPAHGERASIITGGVVGGVAGAVAALVIPGIGPAVAVGWLAVALGGAALGGVAGSFLGAFTNIGVPRQKAHYYEQELKTGHILISVKTADRQPEAMEILRYYGAHDVEAH
jgi:hypothetical protein